ncbi:LysR family transcriptional regulator [Chelatococcus sp. GCM10030263]|uniref:LysR family transcriptional regulator n=1 Tax=Chelatococcus sp. GCM10030263 TaxID=3273387 RepID=UPI003609B0D6
MDRRRLTCFVALAEELHFHRAAARSHISQPGLSQQLRELEDQLQVQLVYRTKRRVSLTRAGEVFLAEARKILRTMDEAVHLARQMDSGAIGQLVVGATAPALFIVLPEIVKRFSEILPRVEIVAHDMTTAEQEAALRRGDIHVGILHPPLDDPSLACREIANTPFDIVLSERNPLARLPHLTMGDLKDERFVIFPRQIGPRLYDHIIALCHDAGFSPKEIVEASPAQSIVAMAACNIGIGFVASRLQHYARPLATYRRLEGPAPQLTLGAAYVRDNPSPALQKFLDVATEVGAFVQ